MEDNYLQVVFTTIMEEESKSLNITALLKLVNYGDETEKEVGYANIYLFNEYMLDSWFELIDNADSISGDVLEVINVLDKAKENEEISGLIAVIDYIEIDDEYIRKGYCGEQIDKILEYLQFINTNYVGLIPGRIYGDRVIQNQEKAINFYINKGFKPLSSRIEGNLVMGKSLL